MLRRILTDQAPQAIGPYSQAVLVAGPNWIFCSGQIGSHPETGELVSENFEEQTVIVDL
jgi:2-iminobutanoate/2-iminopropanoate deaminase